MNVVYAPEAVDDLQSSIAHIQERNPAAALKVANKIFAAVSLLARGNVDGPTVRLSTGEAVRAWHVKPFRLFYVRAGDELRVLRIYHHARRPL